MLVSRGVGRAIDADVIVNHIDLTVVPEAYVQFMARYPVAINGRCTDISKRTVSANLVTNGDGWDGPVIVKTDRNHGGRPERRLGWGRIALLVSPNAWLSRGRWRTRSMLVPDDYPIFESAAKVPPDVWRNPLLVVERFLPEREDDLFVVRSMAIFGDKGVTRRRLSQIPDRQGGGHRARGGSRTASGRVRSGAATEARPGEDRLRGPGWSRRNLRYQSDQHDGNVHAGAARRHVPPAGRRIADILATDDSG